MDTHLVPDEVELRLGKTVRRGTDDAVAIVDQLGRQVWCMEDQLFGRERRLQLTQRMSEPQLLSKLGVHPAHEPRDGLSPHPTEAIATGRLRLAAVSRALLDRIYGRTKT